jgi:hypothetical protein
MHSEPKASLIDLMLQNAMEKIHRPWSLPAESDAESYVVVKRDAHSTEGSDAKGELRGIVKFVVIDSKLDQGVRCIRRIPLSAERIDALDTAGAPVETWLGSSGSDEPQRLLSLMVGQHFGELAGIGLSGILPAPGGRASALWPNAIGGPLDGWKGPLAIVRRASVRPTPPTDASIFSVAGSQDSCRDEDLSIQAFTCGIGECVSGCSEAAPHCEDAQYGSYIRRFCSKTCRACDGTPQSEARVSQDLATAILEVDGLGVENGWNRRILQRMRRQENGTGACKDEDSSIRALSCALGDCVDGCKAAGAFCKDTSYGKYVQRFCPATCGTCGAELVLGASSDSRSAVLGEGNESAEGSFADNSPSDEDATESSAVDETCVSVEGEKCAEEDALPSWGHPLLVALTELSKLINERDVAGKAERFYDWAIHSALTTHPYGYHYGVWEVADAPPGLAEELEATANDEKLGGSTKKSRHEARRGFSLLGGIQRVSGGTSTLSSPPSRPPPCFSLLHLLFCSTIWTNDFDSLFLLPN